jgi:hypothetical protein
MVLKLVFIQDTVLRFTLFWDFTLCKIPEECKSHLQLGGSLKSRKAQYFLPPGIVPH